MSKSSIEWQNRLLFPFIYNPPKWGDRRQLLWPPTITKQYSYWFVFTISEEISQFKDISSSEFYMLEKQQRERKREKERRRVLSDRCLGSIHIYLRYIYKNLLHLPCHLLCQALFTVSAVHSYRIIPSLSRSFWERNGCML